MTTLAISLDDIATDHIYQPRRPTVTNGLPARVAAPPAETCCDCGVDHYAHELCTECGYCYQCCSCAPVQADTVELIDDPDYLCWLHELDREELADMAYDEYRSNGGLL